MGKLAEINKSTQGAYNESMAEQIRNGQACFLNAIKGWELLNLSPYNFKTGKIYEGQNFVFLLSKAIKHNSGAFLTFKQVTELGGKINEGATAARIIFWSFSEAKDKESGEALLNAKGDPYKYAFLKRFNVFNITETSLADLPSIAPQREQTQKAREAVVAFVKNNLHRLENVKNDGLDFNRFLAFFGYQEANKKEQSMGTSWDNLKNAMVGELLNLLICSKIGADFYPVASHLKDKWAELIDNGYIDFLKVAKTAKSIAEEMMAWENLDKISHEPLKLNAGLLSA